MRPEERAARIAALEAELANLKVSDDVKDTSSHERTEKGRAKKGQVHTLLDEGKIGGDFTLCKDPAFLKERNAVFERVAASYAERLAAKPRQPMTVTLPDGSTREGVTWETTPMSIATSISKQMAKRQVVAEVRYTGPRIATDEVTHAEAAMMAEANDSIEETSGKFELWDMTRPLEGSCELRLCDFSSTQGKTVFWHSAAHILGQSLENEFGALLTIGPPLKNGFYYDAYVGSHAVTEDKWYDVLKKRSAKIIKEKQAFERMVVSKEEALAMFAYNPFKLAIIKTKVPEGGFTTVYRNGQFIDLCMGPHAANTGNITCMEIVKHSATYWRGDETADSLQRVYAIAFPDKKQMKTWKQNMELRRKNDHRRIGPGQELFFFHDLSPGSCFFLPHGARMYNALVDFIKAEYWERGYDEVVTPNIFSTDLWKISGHYKHYRDDMFLFDTTDTDEFALKPMNCPGHCLVFRSQLRNYRELPLRMADFGVLHRNERSGALNGLTRVRRFQQDDAHIFCRPDQVTEEVIGALEFMSSVYKIFGMTFRLERSTRPKKAVGADTPEGLARWDAAEKALGDALDQFAGPGNWGQDDGGGAFYGPKIDIKVYDCMDRMHQCATVQLDFNLPIRFDLQYRTAEQIKKDPNKWKKNEDADAESAGDKEETVYKNLPNKKVEADPGYERPVMVHRAMLGSVERMMAILIEHYCGKFPLWLSPRQVLVVPIAPAHFGYATEVKNQLRKAGFHASCDLSNKRFPKKIAEATKYYWNYVLIVGDVEANTASAAVRRRGTASKEVMKVVDFIEDLRRELRDKPPVESAMAALKEKLANSEKKGGKKKDGKGGKKGGAAANPDQDAFTKIDIRVGTIVKAWKHPESDKLWCEEIDLGEEAPRQIASGLRHYYPEESDMVGRRVLVCANLKSAKLAGFKSNGMVICAKATDADKVEFVEPPVEAKNGERVFVEGFEGPAASASAVKKKKLLEAMLPDLKTDGSGVGTWKGKPLMTSAGPCKCGIGNAPMS